MRIFDQKCKFLIFATKKTIVMFEITTPEFVKFQSFLQNSKLYKWFQKTFWLNLEAKFEIKDFHV